MAEVVRINGLVKLAGVVRRSIILGAEGSDLLRVKSAAEGGVAQVNAILQRRGAGVEDLAGPSLRAYRYLAGIRWDEVRHWKHGQGGAKGAGGADSNPPSRPAASTDAAKRNEASTSRPARETVSRVSWSGIGSFCERLMGRLARGPSEKEIEEIRRAIEQTSGRMEGTIRREGLGADRLTPATREWRGWLAWMSAGENVAAYLRAVAAARAALEPARRSHRAAAQGGSGAAELQVEFRPMHFIYKMKTRAGVARVMMPTPMVSFDDAGFADLADLVFEKGPTARQRVVERMKAESYADLMDELEGLGGVVDATRGAAHDLAESFDRVNARYFAGAMSRPRLTWSRSLTRRKFGHYDHVRDWVMLSSTMDHAEVPGFVVDYVMYHELLHKKHGIKWSNGRGYAHTAEFYRDERRFDGWEKGEEWIKKLARGE